MTQETESALVQAARDGNMDAFEQLYRQTAPTITNCARKLARNDAEDLVQATYLRALRAIATFRGECRISTWLCTILRHEAANLMQYTMKHPTAELFDMFEAPTANIDGTLDLQKAFNAISGADRALIHRTLEGYRDSEIAQQLGIPPNRSTLRVQLWRAQRKMQAALGNRQQSSPAQ